MKRFKASLVLLALGIIFSVGIMAQPPSPPLNQGTSGNQSPGNPAGAPIDPGTGTLLILAAAYALKKLYDLRKKPVYL